MKKIFMTVLAIGAILPVLVLAKVGDVNPSPSQLSCLSITHNLQYGSRDALTGGDVSILQDFLRSKGYLNSESTGYFGPLTQTSVKQFQTANGILNSGYVGIITRNKISVICGSNTTNTVTTPKVEARCPNGNTLASNCTASSTKEVITTQTAVQPQTAVFPPQVSTQINVNRSFIIGSAIMQGNNTVGYNATMNIPISNLSNNQLYISQTAANFVDITTNGQATFNITSANPGTVAGDNGSVSYVIPANTSRTFVLSGAIRGSVGSSVQVKVTALKYYATNDLSDTVNTLTSGLEPLTGSVNF